MVTTHVGVSPKPFAAPLNRSEIDIGGGRECGPAAPVVQFTVSTADEALLVAILGITVAARGMRWLGLGSEYSQETVIAGIITFKHEESPFSWK